MHEGAKQRDSISYFLQLALAWHAWGRNCVRTSDVEEERVEEEKETDKLA